MSETRPAEELFRALESVGIDYVIVGSVASGARGEPRATINVDLLARYSFLQLAELAEKLGTRFYFDLEAAQESLRRRRSFNIISMQDVTKFDFFPANVDEYGPVQLGRKGLARVEFLSGIEVPVASAEDVVLGKLRWYDHGGRSSEKQWNDILGILRIQADKFDWDYVDTWAPRLGVADMIPKLPRYS